MSLFIEDEFDDYPEELAAHDDRCGAVTGGGCNFWAPTEAGRG